MRQGTPGVQQIQCESRKREGTKTRNEAEYAACGVALAESRQALDASARARNRKRHILLYFVFSSFRAFVNRIF
jgi:hypothetical protein